jgi:hypothetical protein
MGQSMSGVFETDLGRLASNNRIKKIWGLQATSMGAINTSFHVGSFLLFLKPVIPTKARMRSLALDVTTCFVGLPPPRRSYMLISVRVRRYQGVSDYQCAHDSFKNKTIKMRTNKPYRHPIQYAHLQVMRATRKPKRKGDKCGARTTPIVQILI